MSNTNPASQRHNKRDWRTPISADELAKDPTMVGHTSLLENVPVTFPGQPETGPPVSSPLVSPTPVLAPRLLAKVPISNRSPSVIAPAETTPAETTPAETGPPVLSRAPIVREARVVQDGHTNGEQRVYDAMWKSARTVDEHRRILTIGLGKLAQISNLSESNCKPAIAGLLEKFAIERLPDTENLAYGRTYQIYSWSMVLQRRREAGFTHVIKTRGVVFVNPVTAEKLTKPQTPSRSKTGPPETAPPVSSRVSELDAQIRTLEEFIEQFPRHAQHEQDVLRLDDLRKTREAELPGAGAQKPAGRSLVR